MQNAAHRGRAVAQGQQRLTTLGDIAAVWAGLEAAESPVMRRQAAALPGHEDEAAFMAGIDWMQDGIEARITRAGG